MSTSPKPPIVDAHGKTVALSQGPSRRTRKTRTAARRRRIRDEFDSDGEIERDVQTDSESEASTSSSVSSSASGSELDEIRSSTPPQSFQTVSVRRGEDASECSDMKVEGKRITQDAPLLNSEMVNWSDSVQNHLAGNTDDLPVIDFKDFSSAVAMPAQTTEMLNGNQQGVSPASPPASREEKTPVVPGPDRTSQLRPSARQAYQRRLDEDPSYVPVVGEFWGHDDRLMDKNLRSLSGWWRGRWQGRGRGGFGRDMRRGSFSHGQHNTRNDGYLREEGHAGAILRPIDQTWGHDAYEEMDTPDNKFTPSTRVPQLPFKRSLRPPSNADRPLGSNLRSLRQDTDLLPISAPLNHAAYAQAQAAAQGRPWYAKKPERIWTKQFDAFLYTDPELRPIATMGPGIRIRLKKGASSIIRLPLESTIPALTENDSSSSTTPVELNRSYVVRIPGHAPPNLSPQETESHIALLSPHESFTTATDPLFEPLPDPHMSRNVSAVTFSQDDSLGQPSVAGPPVPQSDLIDQSGNGLEGFPVARGPQHPQLAFTQQYQPPVAYGSPYIFNGGLHPGVVLNGSGYTVDAMTGRPVYLQTPSQHMGQLYAGPMHTSTIDQSLAAPEYLTSPYYQEPQYLQFSLPRQGAQVEIRSPYDVRNDVGKTGAEIRASPSLMASVKAEPFRPQMGYYSHGTDGLLSPTREDKQQIAAGAVMPSLLYPAGPHYYPVSPYQYNQSADPSRGYQEYDDGSTIYY